MDAHSHAKETGLIAWFIKNPVASTLVTIVILFAGFLSMQAIRSEVFPQINPNTVTVSVTYPGATPAEVEEGITRRVEEAVLGLDGIDRVRSTASENSGSITIELDDFADRRKARDDVESAVNQLVAFPPENAEKPVIKIPEASSNATSLVVTGDVDALTLRRAAEKIERDLLTDPDITLVSLTGARDYEISIEVSEETLREYGLSFNEVATAVKNASIDLAGGEILSQGGSILLRVNEKRQSGQAFESIVVRSDDRGNVIRLADIATIVDGLTTDELVSTYNGRAAVFVEISLSKAEDVLQVKAAVDRFLEDYIPPSGVEIMQFKDETLLLKERINLLVRNALFGFALVFGFLVLMLDLKMAYWVCVGIATAFMGGIVLFGLAGVTFTMVSMFGMIIVLGLVVDDAVVIGENVDAQRAKGLSDTDAAIAGVGGVKGPVFVGVLTTIAAFSPLLATGGTFGDIARSIPIVVISVLIVSLFEAFFILPSHLSHSGSWSKGPIKSIQSKFSGYIERFKETALKRWVMKAVDYRYATFGISLVFFIFSIMLVANGAVKFVFFPEIEGNNISGSVEMYKGTPFSKTYKAMQKIEAAAYKVAETVEKERGEIIFKSIAITAGGRTSSGGGHGPASTKTFSTASHLGQVQIELMPFGIRQMSAKEIELLWRAEIGTIAGAEKVKLAASVADFGNDIDFEISHVDPLKLEQAVSKIRKEIAKIDGAFEIEDTYDLGKKQLVFKLNQKGLAAGLKNRDLAQQVRQAYLGEEVQRIQRGREELKVYVRYPNEARRNSTSLAEFRVRLPDGESIPLFEIADVEESRAYASITRIDGRQVINVRANVDDNLTTPNEANRIMLTSIMPKLTQEFPSLKWAQAGSAREQSQDLESILVAFQIVLVIIYALVASQLRSYIQPLAILISIPLGIAGAIVGHYILDVALSFPSIFGIVALAGVAVNASVVLVDYYNQRRREGMERIEAAAVSAIRRFRPVMLTTLTTALGLAPLLFETSPQAQFLLPMAVSLGFGILISGFLVIVVTPAVCVIIEDLRYLLGTTDKQKQGKV
ncbi:efflux RND transporter permease subunit [Temperatibacter marinus]|uniref:Efflux RND transporter permease subunit n=1 Tax=Temperatibacter marinus TaxID=1456591 RepID=A0AA52EF28_9PROT|nr:efflux RND transporter permease subunit [Temperatibacter marinus]WND03555.1 efflux RND transporter permease subunit [Temperatibacter marinus]